MYKKKKIQSVLVDCQHGIGGTLRVKPLTWDHGSNFGSPGIWVVTDIALKVCAIEETVSQPLIFLSIGLTGFYAKVSVSLL